MATMTTTEIERAIHRYARKHHYLAFRVRSTPALRFLAMREWVRGS